MNSYIWKKIDECGDEDICIRLLARRAIHIQKIIEEEINKNKLTNSSWLWITISPDEKTNSIQTFIYNVFRFMLKKFIIQYMYVFEQRSADVSIFEGIHCHILLQHSNRVDNVFRAIKRSFNCYSYVKVCPIEFITDKIKYMTEDKGGEKSSKQVVDKIFREKYNLEKVYTNMN